MTELRVLIDSCVWGGVKAALVDAGISAESVNEWASDPGDAAILSYAIDHEYSILTIDKDFGELAVRTGKRHFGILRLADIPSKMQGDIAVSTLNRYGNELRAGGIVTAYVNKIRVRKHTAI